MTHPTAPGTVYVGMLGGGIARSDDGGLTWTLRNDGLTNLYVQALAIDPMRPDSVYAGTGFMDASPPFFFKSENGGATWVGSTVGPDVPITTIAVDRNNSDVVYAGSDGAYYYYYKSSNAGLSWEPQQIPLAYVYDLAVSALNASVLWAAGLGQAQIVRSTDGGASWEGIFSVGAASSAFAVAIDPEDPSTAFFQAGYLGVSRFTEGIGGTALNVAGGADIAIDPFAHTTVYVASGLGVARSTDSGDTWVVSQPPEPSSSVLKLAVPVSPRSSVFAGTERNGVYRVDFVDVGPTEACPPTPTASETTPDTTPTPIVSPTPTQAAECDAQNLLINSSFEQGENPGSFRTCRVGSTCIPGWTVTDDDVDVVGTFFSPSDGSRSIDLNGNQPGALAQTFATVPGTEYRVVFDLAGNPRKLSGLPVIMQVAAAGQSEIFQVTGGTLSDMNWTTLTWTFTTNAPTATLEFSSLNLNSGPGGPALDNVRVFGLCPPTPTPTKTLPENLTPTSTSTPTTPSTGDCCSPHDPAPGCSNQTCEMCVCDLDANCCDAQVGWGLACAEIAAGSCNGSCGCTPTSTPSPTPTLTPGADLVADQLEVVQAVQDLTNSVRLVANKRTFVRFHVHSRTGGPQLSSAQLRVQRGVEEVVLRPLNPGGQIRVDPAPIRAALEHAFLFVLPSAVTEEGAVTLIGELNPGGSPLETDFTNNETLPTTVSFASVPRQNLVLYSVDYEQDGQTYSASDHERGQLEVYLRRAFPLSSLGVELRSYFAGDRLPTCGEVNSFLFAKRAWDLAFGNVPANSRYYGMVADGGGLMPGCAGGTPSFVASGPTGEPGTRYSWDTDGSYGDWYGAHELAHTWGRADIPFCGAGESNFPYPGGRISPTLDGDTALFGFDIVTRAIYEPVWKDLMSYCDNQWISDVTYAGLMDFFQSEGSADAASGTVAGEHLLVVGTIDPMTHVVDLQQPFVLPQAGETNSGSEGAYTITLLNGATILRRHRFTPQRGTSGPVGDGSGRPLSVLFINELVPYDARTTQVDIDGPIDDPRVHRTVTAGAAAPTVTLIEPNGGELDVLSGQPATITWEADDADAADRNRLRFNVQYSADNGGTWEMLAQNIAGRSVDLDADNITRSDEARFRVWVSDGLHTTSDDSDDPIRVPNRPPRVEIVTPAAGYTVFQGLSVTLTGRATDDIRGGTMRDDQLHWSIDKIHLADGYDAAPTIPESVSVGRHTLTLEALDDEGSGGTHTIDIMVVCICASANGGCDCPIPDELAVSPRVVECDTAIGQLSEEMFIGNGNYTRSIRWRADASEPWIKLSQDDGSTPARVTLTCNPTNLPLGTRTGEVTVTAPDQSVSVSVKFIVAAGCLGDCNDDGKVMINELVQCVNIALDKAPVETCPTCDHDMSGGVEINELVGAVGNALRGCPEP